MRQNVFNNVKRCLIYQIAGEAYHVNQIEWRMQMTLTDFSFLDISLFLFRSCSYPCRIFQTPIHGSSFETLNSFFFFFKFGYANIGVWGSQAHGQKIY